MSRSRAILPISAIGWIVPTSLFAMHDADQDGARRNCAPHRVGVDTARAVDRQIADRGPEPLEEAAGTKNGGISTSLVTICPPLALSAKKHALECKVVGLAAAAREHHFIRAAAEQGGNLAAGVLQGDLCRHARPMATRWIAEAPSRNGRTAAGSTGVLAL